MTVRMRTTSGHAGNRRSHHALKEPRLSKCADCSGWHLRHRMCPSCGKYQGREVVNVTKAAEKKLAKLEKRNDAAGSATRTEAPAGEKRTTETMNDGGKGSKRPATMRDNTSKTPTKNVTKANVERTGPKKI